MQLEFEGQCVDPACVDHGDWATDFPAATGTIVAPLDCTDEEVAETAEMFGLAACRRRHSKTLTLQARELAAGARVMIGTQPVPPVEHVLLYPVEASAEVHTMFPDGSLQPVRRGRGRACHS